MLHRTQIQSAEEGTARAAGRRKINKERAAAAAAAAAAVVVAATVAEVRRRFPWPWRFEARRSEWVASTAESREEKKQPLCSVE